MLKAPVRLGQAALELLFPSSCFGCGRHDVSCVRHVRSLWPRWNFLTARPAPSPFMPAAAAGNARTPPLALDGIRGPFLMEGAIREAIHGLKYGNLKAAAPVLGGLLGRWLASNRVPGE